jgi:hypothetical protein
MSRDVRKITDCYNVTVRRISGTTVTELTFSGRNSRGSETRFSVSINWWQWPYIVREMFKAWKEERAARIAEVKEIDESFNERQAS